MIEREPRSNAGAIIWGTFILFCGVVLLLQVAGVLPWAVWGTLWKFWPVFVILFGISLLLRQFSGWVMFLATAVVLGICLLISAAPYGISTGRESKSVVWNQPAAEIERLRVNADFKGIGVLVSGSPLQNDIVAISAPRSFTLEVGTIGYTSDGKTGELTIPLDFQGKSLRGWEISFSEKIPLDIDVDAEISELKLLLADTRVSRMKIKSALSNCVLELPSKGDYTVEIDSDLSNIEIVLPEDMPAMISADVNLGMLDLDRSRFKKQGDSYVSPDYLTAGDRVRIIILCDLSRVRVR
ncbi:MAG: hypothetical protein Q8O43_00050 [Dehalococcoidia bacterium]|nr:hypothetical protein [Dehalococcoidia bacterium]